MPKIAKRMVFPSPQQMLNRHVSFTVDANVPMLLKDTQLAEAQSIQMFCLIRETKICKTFILFHIFSMSESKFRG